MAKVKKQIKNQFCPLCGSPITADIEHLQATVNILLEDQLIQPYTVTEENFEEVQEAVIQVMKRIGIFLWHDDPIKTVRGIAGEQFKGTLRYHIKHWKYLQEAYLYQEEEIKSLYNFNDDQYPLTEFSPLTNEALAEAGEPPKHKFRLYRQHLEELRDSIELKLNPYHAWDLYYWLNYNNAGNEIMIPIGGDTPIPQEQETWTNPELTSKQSFPQGRPKFLIKARHLEELRKSKRGIWQQITWKPHSEDLPEGDRPEPDILIKEDDSGIYTYPEKSMSTLQHPWDIGFDLRKGLPSAYPPEYEFPYETNAEFYQYYNAFPDPGEEKYIGYLGYYTETGDGQIEISDNQLHINCNLSQKTDMTVYAGHIKISDTPYHSSESVGQFTRFRAGATDSSILYSKKIPINKGTKLKIKYDSNINYTKEEHASNYNGTRYVQYGGQVFVNIGMRALKRNEAGQWFNYSISLPVGTVPSEFLQYHPWNKSVFLPVTSNGEYLEVDIWEALNTYAQGYVNEGDSSFYEFLNYYNGIWDDKGLYLYAIDISFDCEINTIDLNPILGIENKDNPNYDGDTYPRPAFIPYNISTSQYFTITSIKAVTNNILDEDYFGEIEVEE